MSQVMGFLVLILSLVYVYKVWSGQAHGARTYLVSAALVRDESKFKWGEALFRFWTIVRLSIGGFFLPFFRVVGAIGGAPLSSVPTAFHFALQFLE